MGKYANFYDGVRKLLDKIADALDPDSADVKTANYQTAVLNSLSRIGDKVGDVVSATLPDASVATDGDTLVVDDGEWTIGAGSGKITMVGVDASWTLDKTWREIAEAMEEGIVFINRADETGTYQYTVASAAFDDIDNVYFVSSYGGDFYTGSSDGYPSADYDPNPDPGPGPQ